MSDLRQPWLMYLKAVLMLLAGVIAAGILLIEHFNWRFAILLAVAIWGFCRAYYFAFYVIQHYIDPQFRYAGLWSFVRHTLRRRQASWKDL
jgi:hypothetical protein